MKTRLIEIWVGIFVVLGISSLLMLALQVSGLSDFYQEDSGYMLKAEFQNIGGLNRCIEGYLPKEVGGNSYFCFLKGGGSLILLIIITLKRILNILN